MSAFVAERERAGHDSADLARLSERLLDMEVEGLETDIVFRQLPSRDEDAGDGWIRELDLTSQLVSRNFGEAQVNQGDVVRSRPESGKRRGPVFEDNRFVVFFKDPSE